MDPPLYDDRSGYDSREEGDRYDAKMCAPMPIRMKPGDALMSTISVTDEEFGQDFLTGSEGADKSPCPVKSACVLTCLAAAAPDRCLPPVATAIGPRKSIWPGI